MTQALVAYANEIFLRQVQFHDQLAEEFIFVYIVHGNLLTVAPKVLSDHRMELLLV